MPAGAIAGRLWHGEPAAKGERLRRVLNISAATGLLVVCAPIMVLAALLVKLSSRGPVLYTQVRVGVDRRNGNANGAHQRRVVDLGGRPFRIYKFRTMYVSRDPLTQVWARPGDRRVTRVGRVLRKYRIDELPQLFNVLKGDMNLVGPRPEQPRIFLELRTKIENYSARQRVAPGITGLAQVNHCYDRSLDDVRRKLAFDLEYLHRRSCVEDLKIMLLTVPAVLLRRGGW